jgi:hypothetical protein
LLIASSFLLSLVAGEMVDRLTDPRRPVCSGGLIALIWRAWLLASIWLLAFGLTARPLFASAATLVSVAILVAISNIKRRYLREPLIFSDFALLEHVIRHPRLFYIPDHWRGPVLVGIGLFLAAIVGWMLIEPRAIGGAAQALALVPASAILVSGLFLPRLLASTAGLIHEPNPQADIAHVGLLVSLLSYSVAWRLEQGMQPRAAAAMNTRPAPPYDAIIVVQAESFVDLRRFGRNDLRLPAFDRLKERAVASGLIEVPCEGAYTLRPESAVITGLGFREQSFDRFHPYLRPGRLSAEALPRLLSTAGWDAVFVHPYDPSFFRRAHAIPILGFTRSIYENAFTGARRVGPYFSDDAVAEIICKEVRAKGERGLFLYAVTMEAHDPYGKGRLPTEDDPIRQYIHHIENTDRMLARITDEFSAGEHRVLLVFFGDHVPFLPSFADPFPDARTDFVVVELGRNADRVPVQFEITRPEHLHALIRRLK